MISGGDVKSVQKEACGNICLRTDREQCEKLVEDKFADVCAALPEKDKTQCFKKVSDVFVAENNACAEKNKNVRVTDRLIKTAICFYGDLEQMTMPFSTADIKGQTLKGHLAILKQIYSDAAVTPTGISIAQIQKDYCGNVTLLDDREACAKMIGDRYDEVCAPAGDERACAEEVALVFKIQHDIFANSFPNDPVKRDEAFYQDNQMPKLKFDVGEVKDQTIAGHLAILKRKYSRR